MHPCCSLQLGTPVASLLKAKTGQPEHGGTRTPSLCLSYFRESEGNALSIRPRAQSGIWETYGCAHTGGRKRDGGCGTTPRPEGVPCKQPNQTVGVVRHPDRKGSPVNNQRDAASLAALSGAGGGAEACRPVWAGGGRGGGRGVVGRGVGGGVGGRGWRVGLWAEGWRAGAGGVAGGGRRGGGRRRAGPSSPPSLSTEKKMLARAYTHEHSLAQPLCLGPSQHAKRDAHARSHACLITRALHVITRPLHVMGLRVMGNTNLLSQCPRTTGHAGGTRKHAGGDGTADVVFVVGSRQPIVAKNGQMLASLLASGIWVTQASSQAAAGGRVWWRQRSESRPPCATPHYCCP